MIRIMLLSSLYLAALTLMTAGYALAPAAQ